MMYNTVIIEDEPLVANHIEKLLDSLDTDIQVTAKLDSVLGAIDWLNQNKCDLIISDVQLGDGLSFEIFQAINNTTPIIMVTAYDQYAVRAFKENSVDYLLKPVTNEELQLAIQKFQDSEIKAFDIEGILNGYLFNKKAYQRRFLVNTGKKLDSITEDEIAYFYSDERYTILVSHEGKKFILNQTMMEIESKLDPAKFFRINRKIITSFLAVDEIQLFSKSKINLKLKPAPSFSPSVIVSSLKMTSFKKWLNGHED
ncbi:LytTR family DNA-binding domain-containing protein [Cyclobacteriaceae bacterium]|jgi:DNA-binding LytR/AlgR family response regulator|nr:LytTR family DNA-binding domain-containing protein [Cyclobacteriaceae bacterium]|tara:strand:+ start:918 stop:1685 length:768 start_codon:yes stop_codon:yes gene_type:complete